MLTFRKIRFGLKVIFTFVRTSFNMSEHDPGIIVGQSWAKKRTCAYTRSGTDSQVK